jgi:hypothetical protein
MFNMHKTFPWTGTLSTWIHHAKQHWDFTHGPSGYQIGTSAGTTIEGHNAYLESIQFTI